MHVELDKHDIEMIMDALNIMAENIIQQQEEPTGYQPYTLVEVEQMSTFLHGFYN